MTQEVHITRPTTVKLDLGFTPGRRQANKVTILAYIIFFNFRIHDTYTCVSIQILFFLDIQGSKKQIGERRPTRSS